MVRKWMLSIGLICMLLMPMTGFGADAAPKGPKAFLPEEEYRFDTVLEGTEIVHEFVIRNQGDETLEILKVESG